VGAFDSFRWCSYSRLHQIRRGVMQCVCGKELELTSACPWFSMSFDGDGELKSGT
jgi:hypothetical protein